MAEAGGTFFVSGTLFSRERVVNGTSKTASPGPSCVPIPAPCLFKTYVLPQYFDSISGFECGSLDFLEELFEMFGADKTRDLGGSWGDLSGQLTVHRGRLGSSVCSQGLEMRNCSRTWQTPCSLQTLTFALPGFFSFSD